MNFVLPGDWQTALSEETARPYFRDLVHQIESCYSSSDVYPPAEHIFRAFELCSFNDLKVVILGQGPYHSAGQAHGLCFSVNDGVKIPPSLLNVFKELESDIPGFVRPRSGNLDHWATQGVLLLNSVLTVESGRPGSHRTYDWEKFTDAVISTISRKRNKTVFLLWGNYAQKKSGPIDSGKHLVLIAAHPSPLARGAFFGCRHFSKTNDYLISHGKGPVNWMLPDSLRA